MKTNFDDAPTVDLGAFGLAFRNSIGRLITTPPPPHLNDPADELVKGLGPAQWFAIGCIPTLEEGEIKPETSSVLSLKLLSHSLLF